jgi:hypothetical protein
MNILFRYPYKWNPQTLCFLKEVETQELVEVDDYRFDSKTNILYITVEGDEYEIGMGDSDEQSLYLFNDTFYASWHPVRELNGSLKDMVPVKVEADGQHAYIVGSDAMMTSTKPWTGW